MDRAAGFPVLLRGFELALKVEGLSPRTVENYVRDVAAFTRQVGEIDVGAVTAGDVREYLAAFQQGRAPKTVRETQLALRRFYRFLVQEGEVDADPTAGVPLAGYRTDPQPAYTDAEVKRLLMVCNQSTLGGLRNRALVLTLYDTGVRVGELVSMGLPDWERGQAVVSGKTGVRAVPLGAASLQALERYTRRWQVDATPLWRGKKGALTTSGVLQVVRRLCRAAGVEDKGAHAFRRAAAAQMKRLGMNDSDILEVMGWRDVTMLRRYTATVAEELAHRAHRLHSPGDAL